MQHVRRASWWLQRFARRAPFRNALMNTYGYGIVATVNLDFNQKCLQPKQIGRCRAAVMNVAAEVGSDEISGMME